jgi:hypothetical protein
VASCVADRTEQTRHYVNRNSYRAAKGNGFAPATLDRLLTDGQRDYVFGVVQGLWDASDERLGGERTP